ncbi:hypothetical protein ACROYT_G026549 [Oculina patagonica]
MAAVQENLRPGRTEKILGALKAERAVKRITFDRTEANPEETLYVSVPKLNENEVIVPGSLALRFNIDLSGGHANNFLVDNVSRALVDKFVVKYEGTVVQDTVGYDIYKIFEDFFHSQEERDDRVPDGIQSEDLNKIRSNAGDKKSSGVDAEKKLNEIYGNKYRIRLDHQILTDHGAFYPQALFNELVFELKLAAAEHVVRGSDTTKLKYKLTNIQLEYEMIRSKEIADEAFSAYSGGKEFAYDHIQRDKVATFAKGSDTRLNLRVNPQRRSMKGILLLFIEQYNKGARSSEKYINPDLTKVSITVNGSPNMLYNNGIEGMDIWGKVKRFFMKEKNKTQHMTLRKFYTEDKFGLLIDLRSMADHLMHGSGTRLANSKDGVQLELERKASGSGLLGAEPESTESAMASIQRPDIPAMREQLAILVTTGKAKEAIGVQLTYEQVKRLTDKQVEKYLNRYQAYVGAKTTDSLIDSFIFLVTKVVGMAVNIKDVNDYQKEIKNDYIISKELSTLAGGLALKCGRFLALANAALITTKHIDLNEAAPGAGTCAARVKDAQGVPTKLQTKETLTTEDFSEQCLENAK